MSPDLPTADIGRGDWTDKLARIGLVARGVVYFVFGVIVVKLAFQGSTGGDQASTNGAFQELVDQPFGKILVILVGIGLLAWAATCLLGAINGRNGSKPGPSEPKDRAKDAALAVSTFMLALVAFGAAGQGPKKGGGGGGGGQKEATAKLMDAPAGRWLVAIVGLALIGVGLYQVYKAVKKEFLEGTDMNRAPGGARSESLIEKIGMLGHAGKALVFSVIGYFILQAAIKYDPNKAKGVDDALRDLAKGGPGKALLIVIAFGLVAFGVWSVIEAKIRSADA